MHIVCAVVSIYLHLMWTMSWNVVIMYEKGSKSMRVLYKGRRYVMFARLRFVKFF